METVDFIILGITYFLLLVVGIVYFINSIKSKKSKPIHNGLVFSFLFYYLLIPILVLINVDELNNLEQGSGMYCSYTFQRFILEGNWSGFIYSILMVVISFIVYTVVYNLNYKKNENTNYKFKREETNLLVQRIMYFVFLVGFISLAMFFASFGGISNALSYAEQMRNMSNSLVEEIGSAALLKIIARLVTVAPFLLIFLMRQDSNKKSRFRIMLLISLIASMLFYLYNAGRTPIILFALCFIYYIMCKKVERSWTVILLIGILALPLLDVLDSLFVYFNTGTLNIKQTNYLYYLYQFSVPFKNTLVLQDVNNVFGLRWWTDLYKGILDILPGLSFDAAYVDLSLFVRGAEWRNLGGIPADFITFGHMQLSFIGVIIFAALFSYLSQIVDYKLGLFEDKAIRDLFGGVLTLYSFSISTNSDIASIVKGQFIFIFIIFIILKSSKKEKKT